MSSELSALRERITRLYRRDEAACVADLVTALRPAAAAEGVATRARELVGAVRARRSQASGVDHLMHEFSLSSAEGIALMCVAEALLRIPDAATADRLIRDKLAGADWASHLGSDRGLFVNAAIWGLTITGRLLASRDEEALGAAFTRALARCGEPLIRKATAFAMQLLGRQFVMGKHIDAALSRSQANARRGYTHSFDMLGEAALTAADAERFLGDYTRAIHAIGKASAGRGIEAGPGISVKLSALHPRYTRLQRERVMAELLPRVKLLASLARSYDIGMSIDAEEADRLDLSLDIFSVLMADPELADWNGLGFVVQAYQKRAIAVIDYLAALARANARRIMLRLVKGAYWDSEIKRAQVEGLAGYPVFTRKHHTDLSYLACAAQMLDAHDAIYPQFATHNAHSLATAEAMAHDLGIDRYEFQCLHGMGEPLYDNVVLPTGRHCRIYAPVGSYEMLLPYLVRRLLENGSNSSFVNQIVDDKVPVDSLLRDPLAQVLEEGGQPHCAIPLPSALYGPARRNSAGLDLSDEAALASLEAGLGVAATRRWEAAPIVAGLARADGTAALALHNPADARDCVGHVSEATDNDIQIALEAASGFSTEWHATPAITRNACLLAAAEQLEADMPELIALCIREAGKTRANAIAEVREAVDFCRYYAARVETDAGDGVAPGPVVCISPWNFPLAIFIGELSAALATGSPVIAKPAEQTPLIAARAVELFHRAGVPPAALQLLPGRGETVGAALVADARVRGVVFTGSTEVARQIHRAVAGRSPALRLVAETGGQNAMIVDSSAHLEQVVQDVLASGFDSAGQRCSALRVLCVQEEIAGRLAEMLRAAMRELRVGPPMRTETDVGPVIDAEALARLRAHVETLRAAGRPCFQIALPADCAEGHFMAPTLIEIDSLARLRDEVFGPVVHLLRFERSALGALIDEINACGYGLTFGLHTRIEETVRFVSRRIHAGNQYINRNMVGAVVGVQPFGGEGLSGTGPKAGGPLYLARLAGRSVLPADLAACVRPEALPAAFHALATWASERNLAFASRCATFRQQSLFGAQLALPGPTGELNTLQFVPRGRIACLGESAEDLLVQLAAALATGNQALLARDAAQRLLPADLPAEVRAAIALVQEPLADARLAGVLHASGSPALRAALAARPGAILPCVEADARGDYPLWRLLHERVQSVNTTAAGGNASLMMIGA